MSRPGTWMWRCDTATSHLVSMDVDRELSYCGVRAPFSTRGDPDLDGCKRCLGAVRAGNVQVTEPFGGVGGSEARRAVPL